MEINNDEIQLSVDLYDTSLVLKVLPDKEGHYNVTGDPADLTMQTFNQILSKMVEDGKLPKQLTDIGTVRLIMTPDSLSLETDEADFDDTPISEFYAVIATTHESSNIIGVLKNAIARFMYQFVENEKYDDGEDANQSTNQIYAYRDELMEAIETEDKELLNILEKRRVTSQRIILN